MKRLLTVLAAVSVALTALPDTADAKDKPGKGRIEAKIKDGKFKLKIRTPGGGRIELKGDCPPGLARRNPPCVPPGLIRTVPQSGGGGSAATAPQADADVAPAASVRPVARAEAEVPDTSGTQVASLEPGPVATIAEPAARSADTSLVDLAGYHFHGAFAHLEGGTEPGHRHDGQVDYRDAYLLAEDGEVIALTDLVTEDGAQFLMVDEPARYGLDPLAEGESYMLFGDSVVHIDAETYRLLSLVALADTASN